MTSSDFHRSSNEQFRPLHIVYDGLNRVDGSARFGFGNSAALASVSGPIEVRLAAEQSSQATFEVHVRPFSNVPATDSKSQATVIRSALTPSLILTKNPRTLVQLVVQNLSSASTNTERDGLTAAMINASTLALLNAGSLPMRGVVCAVAVGRTSNGEFLVDPTAEEAKDITEGGCFSFMFAGSSASTCVWTNWRSTSGGVKQEHLESGKAMARTAAQRIYKAIKTSLGGESEDDEMET
ncbi:exosome component Rrp46 [Coprinopsis cinerea okayama7|uniref:Exosome component Rrp46 n=1 Tax=Coprinopsis cinerea (strain Okayama-7 / 130 / ATCC MYA-4618 / FGSC 9003) TaxID=240176 RepID=A8N4J8_COPC7|nr:exosome component Rrp46 [Coprinopsis cinerea okayama7\|eukprot:XP_001829767.2 exosome component Rrp46 [Coprinopsis cinerea okayama7\